MFDYIGALLTIPLAFTAIDTQISPSSPISTPLYLTALSSVAACLTSFFSLRNIQKNSRASKSQVLFTAMDHFLRIQKNEREAITSQKEESMREYYIEFFSLIWTEYQSYRLGYIDRDTMKVWMELLNTKFTTEQSCEEMWGKLVKENYYSETDSFYIFIENVRKGNIDKALSNNIKAVKFRSLGFL